MTVIAYESLRDFIERLEGAGRIARVSAKVSPRLEITGDRHHRFRKRDKSRAAADLG